MQREIDATQKNVNGWVKVALYKGNVTVIGRYSPNSLYDEGIASMHEKGNYDPTKARGFIDINAVRLQASAKRDKNRK
jgi:argininosuccinate synthase